LLVKVMARMELKGISSGLRRGLRTSETYLLARV